MSRPLDGRVALVTGAGRGIGRATAWALARAGAAVAVNDLDDEPADQVVHELTSNGYVAWPCPAGIDDVSRVRALVEAVKSELGPIDILVNNAGVASSGRSVHRTEPAEVDQLFRVHALGPFALCHEVLPEMRARRYGRVVMISSSVTESAAPNSAPYAMAKAALEALSRTIATEGADHGITSNIVAPGFVDTRVGREVRNRLQRKLREHGTTSDGPAMLAPGDVAERIIDLITDPDAINGARVALRAPAADAKAEESP